MRGSCIKLQTNSPLLPHRSVRITRHMHKYVPSSGRTRKWGWFESSPSPVLTAENSVRLCWSWTCTDLILQQVLTRSVAAHLQMQTAQQERTDKHKHGIHYMAHIVWVCMSCLPAERHRWALPVGYTHTARKHHSHSQSLLSIQTFALFSCFKIKVHPELFKNLYFFFIK